MRGYGLLLNSNNISERSAAFRRAIETRRTTSTGLTVVVRRTSGQRCTHPSFTAAAAAVVADCVEQQGGESALFFTCS